MNEVNENMNQSGIILSYEGIENEGGGIELIIFEYNMIDYQYTFLVIFWKKLFILMYTEFITDCNSYWRKDKNILLKLI